MTRTVETLQKELEEERAFIRELLDHLDYCGWGDAWERECAEDTRRKAEEWLREHPEPSAAQETTRRTRP